MKQISYLLYTEVKTVVIKMLTRLERGGDEFSENFNTEI